jgi:hypothetical protein
MHRLSAMSLVTVRRRCLVCEWEGEIVEASDRLEIDGECPECRAPTERLAVVRTRRIANPHATALGRMGGLKGGPARAAALTAKRRRELARHAALARWRRR